MQNLKISVIIDNPESWLMGYSEKLITALKERGHSVIFCQKADELPQGDCAFLLGCNNIVGKDILQRNTHNLVVHESALPQGKGWSPLTWQILEGKNEIPVTLFEAQEGVDSGQIYLQDMMHFRGDELVDELRATQGQKTIDLVLKFVDDFPPKNANAQQGKETFYPRRKAKDSELDIRKPLVELFNQLRVADNERYPAFFKHKDNVYIIKINKRNI